MIHGDLKKQLRNLKSMHNGIAPDRAWILRTRETLRAQTHNSVKNTFSPEPRTLASIVAHILKATDIFVPHRFLALSRVASLATFAALFAVGGWIASVSASHDSLPGEALYHVKLATEKTELFIASVAGEETKVETLLRHASNRVGEVQKSKTSDQASIALESLRKSIESTNKSLQEVASGETAVAVATVVNKKTEELLVTLGQAAADTQPTVSETVKQLGEATHLIEVTGVKAVEVLVEQQLANGTSADLTQVKETVEKKLDRLVTDLSEISKGTAQVSAVVASSTVSSSLPMTLVTTTPALTPTSTGQITTSTVVEATMKATEQKVEEANKIAEKEVAEAKNLIGQNDLLGALKKVQTLTEVKNDAGTALLEVKRISDSFIQNSTTATTTVPIAPVSSSTLPAPTNSTNGS